MNVKELEESRMGYSTRHRSQHKYKIEGVKKGEVVLSLGFFLLLMSKNKKKEAGQRVHRVFHPIKTVRPAFFPF